MGNFLYVGNSYQIILNIWKRIQTYKSQEKINHLMYIGEIKLFAKNEKESETLIEAVRIYCQDITIEFRIENCTMLIR